MIPLHLVRVGALANVGCFRATEASSFPRGSRVIVRTDRGLELGEVLAPPAHVDRPGAVSDGTLVRGTTAQDELLAARLKKNQQAAFEACRDRLTKLDLPTVLMDVEQLFDGRTLVFYFLGPRPAVLDSLTDELAGIYDAKAQLRRFADTLTNGCGPDCGTEQAAGSGCQSCGVGCAVADACSTRTS